MIAIYVRASTKRQDTKSQEPDLQRWAEGRDVKFYRDKFTGTTMDRPGWNRLIRDRPDTTVVWHLDRLGRTAKGLTALFDDLQERGITLVSLKDGLDLSTPAGRLMANVLASVAQFETEVRAERILACQEKARSEGKSWGGSKAGRRLKGTPEQIETIQRMAGEGASKSAMARATGLSRPTVYSVPV